MRYIFIFELQLPYPKCRASSLSPFSKGAVETSAIMATNKNVLQNCTHEKYVYKIQYSLNTQFIILFYTHQSHCNFNFVNELQVILK